MKYILSIFILFFLYIGWAFSEPITSGVTTGHDLIRSNNTILDLFTFAERVLLQVVLPLVLVGAGLYIAWELLTAEGNEEKMKKAWKSIVYSVIGLLAIALAYAIISIASRLSI